jgi:hypothetical protein
VNDEPEAWRLKANHASGYVFFVTFQVDVVRAERVV